MVMAAELSGIPADDIERLRSLLRRAGLPDAPPAIDTEDWMRTMGMDKKVQQKKLRFVLLRSLGDAHFTNDFDAERLQQIVGRKI
jgi:3-dehydroquinate synthase